MKQSATDTFKIASERPIQNTAEATGNLIGKKNHESLKKITK